MLFKMQVRRIQQYALISVTVFLCACNSTARQNNLPPLLDDTLFPSYHQYKIESQEEIFALDEYAKTFVKNVTSGSVTEKGKLTALVNAIFNKNQLSIHYSQSANTSASETFHSASANCLSLTILTYAMTQQLGMKAEFQDVLIPEFWTRQGGKTLINRHVNLRVTPKHNQRTLMSKSPLVVDFDPQRGLRQFDVRILSKTQMVAYFYTNKAADYMIEGNIDGAYAYLRAAINTDPNNESAWLNLGVLMSQNDFYDKAMQYYQYALYLKPHYPTIYQNVALIYKRQGDEQKAKEKLAILHKQRLQNPYYHVMLGDVAIEEQAYDKAIKHYREAISLNDRPHEFYFSLAKAYHATGDIKNTKRALEKAKRKAGDIDIERHYASKLSMLLANRQQHTY